MTSRPPRLPDGDPTATGTLAGDLVAAIWGEMAGLDDAGRTVLIRRFGLRDGQRRTLSEVADSMGMPAYAVAQVERAAIEALRRQAGASGLTDYLDDDTAERVSPGLRNALLGGNRFAPALVHCERHGWTDPVGTGVACAECPCHVEYALVGRRPRYCSDACRQVAYRRRRAEQKAARATPPEVG